MVTNPTLRQVLGCGLAKIQDQRGKMLKGSSRLFTIVVSESAYLIWRLRCEWRIEREENQSKIHMREEVTNRWLALINTRLKLDCQMADKQQYGRKAIDPTVVMRTWNSILVTTRKAFLKT